MALPPVRLLGADTHVTCVDGSSRRYVDLDRAASTPVLAEVWEAVEDFVPWYSSVHRGSGQKSQVATAAFEGARDVVARFVGARPDHGVVFVRNTTEAINVLAAALPPRTRVLSTALEHHANMLPWRRHELTVLPFTRTAQQLYDTCELVLAHAYPRIELLALTGASNVTGEVLPLADLAALAHRHGARVLVDAAQLAPHRAIDMAAAGIDFLALSGHKLYAPFGSGALVGDLAALTDRAPLIEGGGAIKLVTLDDVVWADAPDRFEAGTPNVIGVVALAAACRHLMELGMEEVAAHERRLARRMWEELSAVPGLRMLTLWPPGSVDRVGVASFTLERRPHSLVAAALSAEHAIGVRHGCFCAHPLITRLLGVGSDEVDRLTRELRAGGHPPLPGAVRASVGLGTSDADVDRLVAAVTEIAVHGPCRRYERVPEHDEHRPVPELADLFRPAARRAAAVTL
jgi:selenocysteine lyase/cysteine desulfurase